MLTKSLRGIRRLKEFWIATKSQDLCVSDLSKPSNNPVSAGRKKEERCHIIVSFRLVERGN